MEKRLQIIYCSGCGREISRAVLEDKVARLLNTIKDYLPKRKQKALTKLNAFIILPHHYI
jgi:hypothetical protein